MKRGVIIAEDEALRAKLSNLTVPGKDGPVKAKVFYRGPDATREVTYPFVTLDLVDINFAPDRAHSAQLNPVDYWPSEYATFAEYAAANAIDFNEATDSMLAMWWVPYDLTYQVTTYTRYAAHDRALLARLLSTAYIPYRFGYLHVPADGSERVLELMGQASANYTDASGPIFRRVYDVRVEAHMAPEDPLLFKKVLELHVSLTGGAAPSDNQVSTSWEYAPPP